MATKNDTLYVIDGSSYIYRAFFAMPELRTSRGIPTNAVYGFVGMLNRVLREGKPVYLAVALDAPGPTFRHELSPDYKATRPQMPEALSVQIPFIKRIIAAYGISSLEVSGYEADDIIGTFSTWAVKEGVEVVIVSGDKDLLQLVGPRVHLWDTMKNEFLGSTEVKQAFGVSPSQVVEVRGLSGDSSDNIPGVPGIGPKTAQRLIQEFGSIENLLANLHKVSREKERSRLENFAEQAKLSRELATIDCNVPMDKDLQRLKPGHPDREALINLFRELEFHTFLQDLQGDSLRPATSGREYCLVTSREDLGQIVSLIRLQGQMSLALLTDSKGPRCFHVVGLALAWGPEAACYIPVGHADHPGQLDLRLALKELTPALNDPAIAKVAHDGKAVSLILKDLGVDFAGLRCDPMLAAYLLDPGRGAYDLTALAGEHLNESLATPQQLGGGKSPESFAHVSVGQASSFAAERADCCFRLAAVLEEKLKAAELTSLFRDIELPLVGVLARMELNGVRVEVAELEKLGRDLERRLGIIAEQIYALAGEHFNINSPQQLATILFEKLGLPTARKTKTGYSTDMEVLSTLAGLHPLPSQVLHYRSLMKLKGTYVDALPRLVNPRTGRIHTSYNQTVTATGRLSSSEPNLQNIPVRTEEGRGIRRAFVAEPGYCLISADYSQVELRILAHYSQDQSLIAAFQNNEDIHGRTAAELFGVPPPAVTPEMRRQAKTINFGIIYGISPFGLGRELNIPQNLAREMISRYFQRYEGVRAYVDQTPRLARQRGYVTTLFGRKRFLPDLHSRNRNVRQFAERTAINTPIQGTAADIIKMAMVRIDKQLAKKRLPARMIMQVHDELVFEVKAEAAAEVADLVRREMEAVADLCVRLVVDVGQGLNWEQVHPA